MKKLTKAIILTSCICWLSGCTDDSKATSVLAAQGYTRIQITDYNWLACYKDDFTIRILCKVSDRSAGYRHCLLWPDF